MQENVKNIEEIFVEFTEPIQTDSYNFKLGSDQIALDGSIPHGALFGNDLQDQHPINAITGLKEELDEIKSLKTVYSDKRHCADYYLWNDENTESENRVGRFVTIRSDLNKITLCTSKNDIFGVTVDRAAFVGNYEKDARDESYGLVVTTGAVDVQCESTVLVGDCVISNDYGVATKINSKYGYKVLALKNINGVLHASISLGAPISQVSKMANDISDIDGRVKTAELNAAAAVNFANDAHVKIDNINTSIDNTNQKVDESINGIENKVDNAVNDASNAKQVAEELLIDVERLRTETVDTANEAVTSVHVLIKDLDPVLTFPDSDSENVGAIYMTKYLKEGVATKSDVAVFESDTKRAISELQQNAEGIQTLVSSIDKYSVGEFSQAYGLTKQQAASILKNHTVYIPTVSHEEVYGEDSKTGFMRNYYYTWNNDHWDAHNYPTVLFSHTEPAGVVNQYWFLESNVAPDGYEPYTLYRWDGNQWVKISILDGNVNNRITSLVRQTADAVKAEVSNARGSSSSLDIRLTNTEASIKNVTTWSKGGKDDGYTLAAVEQIATGDGATLSLMVANEDGVTEVDGASIILGVGEEKSYIDIKANRIDFTAEDFKLSASKVDFVSDRFTIDASKIDFTGEVTFLKPDDLGENGSTEIYGGRITTGTINANDVKIINLNADNITTGHIKSEFINTDGLKITNGTYSGSLTVGGTEESPTFSVDTAGNMICRSGRIAGWYVDNDAILSDLYTNDGSFLSGKTITGMISSNGSTEVKVDGNHVIVKDYRKSLVKDATSQVRFIAGCNPTFNAETETSDAYIDIADNAPFVVLEDGSLYISACQMRGANSIVDLSSNGLKITSEIMNDSQCEISSAGLYTYTVGGSNSFQMPTRMVFGALQNEIGSNILESDIIGLFIGIGGNTILRGPTGIGLLSNSNISIDTDRIVKITAGERIILSDELHPNTVNYMYGTWNLNGTETVTSDRNLKHDIAFLDDKYTDLFDRLQPVKFKYNDGASNRYHTGFIAQDVCSAIEDSGLNTNDFAAYVKFSKTDNEGTSKEECGLRYDEFIALNTWQIQKAKSRISALEDCIETLKERISQLETKGE